jgi:hypothetical protein
MKKQAIAVFSLLLLLPCLGAAQIPPAVNAEISFAFSAGDKPMTAGGYEFTPAANLESVTITNLKTRQSVMVLVTTRLSQRAQNEASVVFDKVGDQYYLSEVYVPGMDGFAFKGAPGQHSHHTVKAKK